MNRFDLWIRGALVVDGTGETPGVKDVGVRNGKIAFVGSVDGPEPEADEKIDADGLVLSPGFIDPHTHYDAQLGWDPTASPSNLHGVTTVIGGNCGFSIAPLGPNDADYIRRMMSVVEGMPLEALEQGLDWNWRSFGDWLGQLDGNTAVNAGFLVGHCAIRRTVMGEEAVSGPASEAQIQEMKDLLKTSLKEGGIGFSTSRSFSHRDGDGNPVASRAASEEEVTALCEVIAEQDGTSLEFITDGCLLGFSEQEIDLMTRMSLKANRPLNWNVMSIDSAEPGRYENQIKASNVAAEQGARVVALTMPILVGMTMSFLTYSPIHQLPGWQEILSLPLPDRKAALGLAEVREKLLAGSRSPDAGVFSRVADFPNFRIGETYSDANKDLTGRLVKEIAAEREMDSFDTLIEIVLADDLRTVLWPVPPDDDEASWELRKNAWDHPQVLLGGSDAGAHLDRMCGAPYTTQFLADCIRGRQTLSLEKAIQAMSDTPARLFGLHKRGRIEVGHHADIVLFDPKTVGAGEIHNRRDLPGKGERLFAESKGIRRVWVNGRAIVIDGEATDERPGQILRSGRDTHRMSITDS